MEEDQASSHDSTYYNGSLKLTLSDLSTFHSYLSQAKPEKEIGMDKIQTAAGQLIDAVKDSQIYQEYCKSLQKVKEVNGLKEKIDEFRQRNFELQNNRNIDLKVMEEFEERYEDLREDPLVSEFLEAELAFCRMMQDIIGQITEAVNFE